MTLDQLNLIKSCLADWTHQDFDKAVAIVDKEIAKVTKGYKPLSSIPAHQRHSVTSTMAAMDVAVKFTGVRLNVLKLLAQTSLTDEEAQFKMNMTGNSYRPCRISLTKAGLVEESGEYRRTIAKKYANVWQVTSKGIDYLKENR